MSSIVLATLNARFIHASVGLRYLYANMAELQSQTRVLEFEVSQAAPEIVEALIAESPSIIGFGVYIWNTAKTREVIAILRKVRPDICIIVGGPEVSFEYESQPLVQISDYLITGEADVEFAALCRRLLAGEQPEQKVTNARLPELSQLRLPYEYYSDSDIANRVIYVEVSRGCPFTCEFCLSSIDVPVRQFDVHAVLTELDTLYRRGARTFKFIDRTFNLHIRNTIPILEFFLERMVPGLFVHFEMVPDRFPEDLRAVVARFPRGSLQLEIGVQTLNPEVGALIRRRQNVPKLFDNLRFLRQHTGAHLHVDLIVGLPGEGLASFGKGFDQIVAVDPQEIQVGILKKLRGTPIVRHEGPYNMQFSEEAPYEILQTQHLSFLEVQRLARFARYWDLVANSGNFVHSRSLLWQGQPSPFYGFLEFSDWLFAQVGRRASINLKSLVECVVRFLVDERGLELKTIGPSLVADYVRGGRSDVPSMLREFVSVGRESSRTEKKPEATDIRLKRQQRASQA